MYIKRIKVQNFRLLKDFSIDIQKELSLIVGKNNVGKTSLLVVLDKCLNSHDLRKKFQYCDFNPGLQDSLESILDKPKAQEDNWIDLAVKVRIIVEFNENDNLDNIGNRILTNLESDNNYFAIGFDYVLNYQNYCLMHIEYQNELASTGKKSCGSYKEEFLNTQQHRFFKMVKKSIHVNKDMTLNEERYIALDGLTDFRLDDVIQFEYIRARRSVDNKDPDHTLSAFTSELYSTQENNPDVQETRRNFSNSLRETDTKLTEIYSLIFKGVVDKVGKLGGMHQGDSVIEVISTLSDRELLKGNTTVVYKHGDKKLPEFYNGLGYMNLISMIFEISLIKERMKRVNRRRPADINLLFIEEPEAHTHPQMQNVFIKNIKGLLTEGVKREGFDPTPLQYIISTHSSHIVANCDFEDIRYIKRTSGVDSVEAKNLCDLNELYKGEGNKGKKGETQAYRFLKQYLTVMNSELLFADKAIIIEGDTERILLPVMMKKVDEKFPPDYERAELELLSQKISIVPVGAHSHIFEKFFHFIGLEKLLIITDLDICGKDGKKCCYSDKEELVTSNSALKHYFKSKIKELKLSVNDLMNLSEDEKKLAWSEKERSLIPNSNGNVMVCFQTKEGEYQPRTFEDNFFHLNASFICKCAKDSLGDLCVAQTEIQTFKEDRDAFKLAQGITKKTTLAISLLLLEKDDRKWQVPKYIEDGLKWLRN